MNDTASDHVAAAPRPGTAHPHLARERALKVLFAADVRGVDPRVLLDEVETHPADLELLDELEPDEEQVAGDRELQFELTRRRRLPLDDYTRTLVEGVAARGPAIDALLGEVADRWQVQRMPAVDRNLLRLAVYELSEQDTPHAVVIDEAVSLAIAFAGEKARSFVNGVLETVRQRVAAGEVELTLTPEPAEPTVPVRDEDEELEPGEVAEDVTEPDLTTDTVEEVDEAAQQAYDLALDLLDAEGPLDPWDDATDPMDADEVSDGEDTRFEQVPLDELAALEDPEDDDEDDALW